MRLFAMVNICMNDQVHSELTAGLLLAALALAAVPAWGAPSKAEAALLFADAKALCDRDHGALWNKSLCGPILLVDYTDLGVLANQSDREGKLTADGAFFRGTLPTSVIIANTPTEWAGVRWTQIVGPIPREADKRHVLLAHELFHRIQPDLGLTRPETPNQHLDTLEGRYLIELEWRALARALKAVTKAERQTAISDALAFRHERYRLFPEATKEEGALEINEGVPEYTGVRLGLTTQPERVAFAVYDLSAFVQAPTFVRSFAYATGPAYGLLLDGAAPAWRSKISSGKRLDELLSEALPLALPDAGIEERAARYDDGTLRASEVRRDVDRRARLASLKERLVDGPALILPLKHSNYQFNPQTLIPLEGFGIVYPTMRLTDDWGALEVEHGGALVRSKGEEARVSVKGANQTSSEGDGWRLTLKPGWRVQAGSRAGDLVVTCSGACSP